MGISGIFKEIGQGKRISLLKLASDHYIAHDRPLRLAIDISIWLFQIQAGKGGSNPALRTFYYRLLRLLSLNIHPLFVFDGPNKPKFKRNKKVGGPGVKVVNVPEFLAKQLLKQFGFPMHVAPGEAEAECALLQKEGIVDAVLSDDVDTLMFGSGLTLRNWTPEGSSKTPTHVNVYRAKETKESSGLDREGMILVALMSGGDYVPEGIPGCGIKFACDAARAGFGKEMCDLMKRRDNAGMIRWRERMQHELRTNESKLFSRKNSKLVIPDEFPDREILGYYTDPCLSTSDKLERLRSELQWDKDLDFAALRSFAADAFDWRCIGGAKKFIRNLAPALLVRELRLRKDESAQLDRHAQGERELTRVTAIHGKRNHKSTDSEREYRITYIPKKFVPIDLSIEDEDEDFTPAGMTDEAGDVENDFQVLPSSTDDENDPTPSSPSKRRAVKPYNPDEPEKIWMVHSFLKVGCPLLVEDYESSSKDGRAIIKQRQKARAATGKSSNIHAKKSPKKKANDMPENALHKYTRVQKAMKYEIECVEKPKDREPLKPLDDTNSQRRQHTSAANEATKEIDKSTSGSLFASTQPLSELRERNYGSNCEKKLKAVKPPSDDRPFRRFGVAKPAEDPQRTPKRTKRPLPNDTPPASSLKSPGFRQTSITSYTSPSPRKNVINLISSSPARPEPPRVQSPTPVHTQTRLSVDALRSPRRSLDFSPGKLPNSVTKRRKREPLKRHETAPARGEDLDLPIAAETPRPSTPDVIDLSMVLSSPENRLPTRPAGIVGKQPAVKASMLHRQTANPPERVAVRPSADESSRAPLSDKERPVTQPQQKQKSKKMLIQPRESLPGAWKEVEAEMIDCTGDGSGWKSTHGKAKMSGFRKSGIEVVDMSGA